MYAALSSAETRLISKFCLDDNDVTTMMRNDARARTVSLQNSYEPREGGGRDEIFADGSSLHRCIASAQVTREGRGDEFKFLRENRAGGDGRRRENQRNLFL